MNQPLPEPSSRDEILGILLAAALAGAVAGGIGYAVGRTNAKKAATPAGKSTDVAHAVMSPQPLKDIATAAKMQPPTALVHLRRLEEEGKVEKRSTPDGPRYAVLPYLRCEWIDPDHGIQQTWQSKVAVDWRFPLVSRVPDERAQAFLLEWLDRAQARDLLPAYQSRHEPQAKRPHGLHIVVYGSCARGDAGATSDVDILLVGDLPKRDIERLKDLAAEIALRGGRRPDVRSVGADLKGVGATLAETLRREGRTIFTSLPEPAFIETMGARRKPAECGVVRPAP